MLLPVPTEYRRRPRKLTPQALPAALTLVSAAYTPGPGTLVLSFDRAIDIDALQGSAIVVDDGVFEGLRFDAMGGAVLLDPTTVQLTLTAIGDPTGTSVVLEAGGANGIVAVNDGGTWEGVSALPLPFP